MKKRTLSAIILAISLSFFAAGCKKKVPVPPAPPAPVKEVPKPPPPPAPSISFSADPSTITRGESSTLRWSVTNATDISINQGVGSVSANGTRTVYPSNTTEYVITATGPGGSQTASARVNVNAPPPPPPPPPAPKASLSERVARELQDAYFNYDKSDVREDARTVLTRNADALKAIFAEIPSGTVMIEGHCDERGSAQYNVGLGDRRSTTAKDFLVQLGVPADRLKTISYGKEKPVCTEANESCWQKNRRAHFAGQD